MTNDGVFCINVSYMVRLYMNNKVQLYTVFTQGYLGIGDSSNF